MPAMFAYLCYIPDQNGTLELRWTPVYKDARLNTPPAEALACFVPGKPVPAWKVKTNAGRVLIQTGVNEKRKFFLGYGQFLKEAFMQWQAKQFKLLRKADAREQVQLAVVDRADGLTVRRFTAQSGNNKLDASTAPAAFAIVNEHSTAFHVGTMDRELFLQKAMDGGFGADLVMTR